jgi:Fe-S cluster biogenesis protein NfuA
VSTRDDEEIRRRLDRLQTLIQEIERFSDPGVRAHAQEMVQAILEYHGAGLTRLLDRIAETGETGRALIAMLAGDELVSSLLLLYGLHPLNLETRVQQALERVRPYLRTHGGGVELLSVAEGVVRLRMQGSCHGCPSSAMTLKLAIEEAIVAAAPDASAIEVEGVIEPDSGGGMSQSPIVALEPRLALRSPADPGWVL